MKNKLPRFTAPLLALFTLISLFAPLIQHNNIFGTPFDAKQAKKAYEQSQWRQSQNVSPLAELDRWAVQHGYTGWKNYVDDNGSKRNTERDKQNILQGIRNKGISDTMLYSYAGYVYAKGGDPTLMNPEHPPFGKYLIGWSILLFHNENALLPVFGAAALLLTYLILKNGKTGETGAWGGAFLLSIHPLFVDQLIHGPQLELFQLCFFLLLAFLIQRHCSRRTMGVLIAASVTYGLLLSIKTTFTFAPLFAGWMLLVFLKTEGRKNGLIDWLIVQGIGFVTFVLTYGAYFAHGGTFRKWFGVQKYIVLFYRQAGIDMVAYAGNYLRLIYTGSWKFWSGTGELTRYQGWDIYWPFLYTGAVVSMIWFFHRTKRIGKDQLLPLAFFLFYNIFLFAVPMFPRYLLLLYATGILVMVYAANGMSYEKRT